MGAGSSSLRAPESPLPWRPEARADGPTSRSAAASRSCAMTAASTPSIATNTKANPASPRTRLFRQLRRDELAAHRFGEQVDRQQALADDEVVERHPVELVSQRQL